VLHILSVFSPSYPACDALTPYYMSCPAYYIFPYYIIKGTIFEKKKQCDGCKMCVLIVSINFETFLIPT